MNWFFDSDLGPLAFIGILILSLGAVVTGLCLGTEALDCHGFQTTGYETRYSWGSCYAKVDGRWVPSQYVFGEAKELRIKEKK